ncbi:MAG: hypothetical protein HYR97_02430 [Candidatus Melainabacteria bacterium]|nr:hypothetical protein [Candidatus Melainabacteria bacterium]MBI3309671.1 hypothetical protein [Candidatus Melainabacteria bacterium]
MSITTSGVSLLGTNASLTPQATTLSEPANYSFPKQFPMYQITRGEATSPQTINIIEEGYYFGDPVLARKYLVSQKQRGVQSLVIIKLDSWETGGVLSLQHFVST